MSPFVVWLGSGECDVTGRAFEMAGGEVCVIERLEPGPGGRQGRRVSRPRSAPLLHGLVATRPSPAVHGT